MAYLFILGAICLPGLALGWNDLGHMVVAQIAYDRLTTETRARVDALIAVKVKPAKAQAKTATFITAACWADDVKVPTKTGTWHYVNLPFSLDGTEPRLEPVKMDVVRAIEKHRQTLSDPRASEVKKAQALRYLIHFVADIHQPLHCTTAVSAARPGGDRGGNEFKINGFGDVTNLHYLWDCGVGLLNGKSEGAQTPEEARARVVWKAKKLAREIARKFPPTSAEGARLNLLTAPVTTWAEEGRDSAKTAVYAGLKEGSEPDGAYVENGKRVTQEKLARAGYRLAAMLNEIMTPPPDPRSRRQPAAAAR